MKRKIEKNLVENSSKKQKIDDSVIKDYDISDNDNDFNLDSFSIQTIFSYLVPCSDFQTCFNFSSVCKLFNIATIQTLIQYDLSIENGEDTKLIEVNYLPYFQLKEADLAQQKTYYWKTIKYIDGMLIQCSTLGFYKSIPILIKNGANIFSTKFCSEFLSFLAAENGFIKTVEQFLLNGMDINHKTESQDTLLLKAKNLKMIKFLIGNNAEVNVKNNWGITPLLKSAKNNNLDMVTYLVEKNSEINTQDNRGDTPLLYASRHNNLDMIKYLIEKNANINTQNQNGYTAVMLVIDQEQENLETVQYFFTLQNLDLTLKNNQNETTEDLVQKKKA